MGITGRQLVAFGTGAAFALMANCAVESTQEHRPAYPAGLVCTVPLEQGSSPHELANGSLFAADAQTVFQRSQFVNPGAVLAHSRHDDQHYQVGSPFNVMLKEVHLKRPTNRPYFEDDYRSRERPIGTCAINSQWSKLVSTFPDLQAATKILNSTVAVIETNRRSDEIPDHRRCGAIAVASTLLLPSRDFVAENHACADLKAAETEDDHLKITKDQDTGPWRLLETDHILENQVEIADDYVPRQTDILIYSGYDVGGMRQYFRVEVIGEKDGRLMLRAGIDQTGVENQIYNQQGQPVRGRSLRGGTGGFFTTDGRLVAITESSDELIGNTGILQYATDEYRDYVAKHDRELEEETRDYGYMDYGNGREQYVTALRVHTEWLNHAKEKVSSVATS